MEALRTDWGEDLLAISSTDLPQPYHSEIHN